MNQGMYNRGIPEYDRLDADRWMEATWMAKKNAMMSNAGMSASDAAAYATGHVVSESIGRNIYNAAGDKLFDNNGKLIATRLAGYDDLDWQMPSNARDTVRNTIFLPPLRERNTTCILP